MTTVSLVSFTPKLGIRRSLSEDGIRVPGGNVALTEDQVLHVWRGPHGDPVPLPCDEPTTSADARDRLHWILDHLPASRPGRPVSVLDLGCADGGLSMLLAERGDRVTGVDLRPVAIERARRRCDRLPADVVSRLKFTVGDGQALDGVADASFDAAAVGELLDQIGDPVRVLCELHRTLSPGATLVLTVPYGVSEAILRLTRDGHDGTGHEPLPTGETRLDQADGRDRGEGPPESAQEHEEHEERRRVFYHGSLRHLVEPLFEIRELTVLRGHLAVVAARRDEPRGTPGFALSRAETAFLQRERLLHREIDELRERCARLAERESTLMRAGEELLGRNAELRAEATRLGNRMRHLEVRLGEYREVIARLRRSRAWRLITAYRRVLRPSSVGSAKRPIVISGSAAAETTRPALPDRA